MQVGWVKIGDCRQITGYISKTVQDRRMVSIMYVGLFCHSAVAFNVSMFFSCFYVLRTGCVVVFFSVTLLIYSAVGL